MREAIRGHQGEERLMREAIRAISVDGELALGRGCEQLFTVPGACKLGRWQKELYERPMLMHGQGRMLCRAAGERRAERDQRERDEERNHVQPETARRGGGAEAQAEAREQNEQ
jgi:hypothetical protein